MIEKTIRKQLKRDFKDRINLNKFGKPYYSPSNYSNWRGEILVYAIKSFDPYTEDKISNHAISVSQSLVKYNFPTYYVSRDLTVALWNTISKLKAQDLNIASPAVNFMLPTNTIISPEGDFLTSLGVASPRKCKNLKYIYDTYGDGLMGCAGFVKNKFKNSYWYSSFQAKADIPENEAVFEEYMSDSTEPFYMENPKEKEFSNKFRHFIFNLMCILESKPFLISQDIDHPKTRGFGCNSKESEYRSPIWLGKSYKVESKTTTLYKEGKLKSPHFRKGHLRKQRFGKNREETKIIWVNPVMVNTHLKSKDQ